MWCPERSSGNPTHPALKCAGFFFQGDNPVGMPAIEAILFDFDHTLGIDHKLEEVVLRELAASYCSGRPDDDAVRGVLARFRSGAMPVDVAVAEGLLMWGCPERNLPHAVKAFRERCLALAPERVEAMPGARETLRDLAARRVPLGILSNGWSQLQHLKAWLINFPGPVLVSEEIGAWKPDARAFAIALERLGMRAQTTVYVGDESFVDVAGAKSAGMLAAWADLEGKRYPVDAPPADFTITALNQLPTLLDG
jgi:putative hydrolase of the HAD superfamily